MPPKKHGLVPQGFDEVVDVVVVVVEVVAVVEVVVV